MSSRWALEEEVTDRLEAAGVPTPDVDARLLLDAMEDRFGTLGGCPSGVLDALVRRRAARVPLQVLLGSTTFRWVDLEVVAGVFVPRPETEIVAGAAIDACRERPAPLVVEPCTGTGAITCALLTEVSDVTVHATDVAGDAVALARRNVDRTLAGEASPAAWRPSADSSAQVYEGSLLEPLTGLGLGGRVDVLVSNPPYLPSSDRGTLAPEVAEHDPPAALFGGVDGHEVVDRLLVLAGEWLAPGGTVVLEIDDRRATDAREAARAAGLAESRIVLDLAGRARALVATRRR